MNRVSHYSLWICTLILLFVATVTTLYLHDDSIYIDERISIEHLGNLTWYNTLLDTAQSVASGSQQHSPGYFWLLNGWARLTGYSQVSLRYISVLIGFVSLAVLYRIGRNWYGHATGILAMGILGASALNLYYFHEIRMYTLITLLMLLIMWQYQRIIRPRYEPTRWDWLGMFAAVSGLLYTHYFALFPLIGIGIYHLLFVAKNRRWLAVSAVFILAGMSFVPWLTVAIDGTTEVAGEMREGLPTLDLMRVFVWLFANGQVVLMVTAALGFVLALPSKKVRLPLLIGAVVLSGLILANSAVNLIPIRRSRYFLVVLPFAALVVGYGLTRLPRWHWYVPLLMALWFYSGYQLHAQPSFDVYTNREQFELRDYPPFPAIIKAFFGSDVRRTPDDLLLMVTNSTPGNITEQPHIAEFYWRRLNVRGPVIEPMTFSEDDNHALYNDITEGLLSSNPMVVYLGYDPVKTEAHYHADIVARLEPDYVPCDPLEHSDRLHLEVFVRYPAPCSIIDPSNLNVRLAEEPLKLEYYAVHPVDNQLAVTTRWAMLGMMPFETYAYSLLVVDANGDIIAQHDNTIPLGTSTYGIPDGTARHAMSVFDTATWAAGDYTFKLVVYDPQTGTTLTDKATSENDITLTTFTLEP